MAPEFLETMKETIKSDEKLLHFTRSTLRRNKLFSCQKKWKCSKLKLKNNSTCPQKQLKTTYAITQLEQPNAQEISQTRIAQSFQQSNTTQLVAGAPGGADTTTTIPPIEDPLLINFLVLKFSDQITTVARQRQLYTQDNCAMVMLNHVEKNQMLYAKLRKLYINYTTIAEVNDVAIMATQRDHW